MPGLTKYYGVTLDCPNPPQLAEFYQHLTGLKISYNTDDFAGLDGNGGPAMGFQRVEDFRAPQWPEQSVPQQFHLDFQAEDLDAAEKWVVELGGTKADNQPGGERWRVFLDPAGHPFCISTG
ncbi:VOC family protein [Streptomyces sp. NBC_01485]|uniref:VOC family protein n=1 Tax=Streptomyces sp. NBC_01485 TaxID=2903884 RepID=UPI002E321376|nr:VOC family protein [Streptomyces sp. NBC_01485]